MNFSIRSRSTQRHHQIGLITAPFHPKIKSAQVPTHFLGPEIDTQFEWLPVRQSFPVDASVVRDEGDIRHGTDPSGNDTADGIHREG